MNLNRRWRLTEQSWLDTLTRGRMSREQAVQMSDRFQSYASHFRSILLLPKTCRPAISSPTPLAVEGYFVLAGQWEAKQEVSNPLNQDTIPLGQLIFHAHLFGLKLRSFHSKPLINWP